MDNNLQNQQNYGFKKQIILKRLTKEFLLCMRNLDLIQICYSFSLPANYIFNWREII